MDFTAIDFETANHNRYSACQLAAVKVRNGKIVDRQCWLIKPRPFYFNPMNVQVHGIHPDDVQNEPEFCDCWESIARCLENECDDKCLIAHNAPFDIGVLTACLSYHDIPVPDLQFSCTRLIARHAWPGRTSYGLKPLASWLGIEFRHHDALEDSIACASILLAAADSVGADSIIGLEAKLALVRGTAGGWGYRGATRARQPRQTRKKPQNSINATTK